MDMAELALTTDGVGSRFQEGLVVEKENCQFGQFYLFFRQKILEI